MTRAIAELARAKINLTLEVLGRRPDGYHEIESLVAFADAGDRLTLDTSRPPGLEVTGPFAAGIAGPNILSRAIQLLQQKHPELILGHIRLEKFLPVAAGIGGGSADAAAFLRAVRTANPDTPGAGWRSLAQELGADVPVCLENRASFMTGIGECVTPLREPLPDLYAVLVNPQASVPGDKTARVFRALGARSLPASYTCAPEDAFTGSSAACLARLRHAGNDLTDAAIEAVPEISAVLGALSAIAECQFARLSGAGPTCFGIFATREQAASACAGIEARHPAWWAVSTPLS